MLNFVLCDDNLVILKRLSDMMEKIFINNDLNATIGFKSTNANEIIEYVDNNKTDVLMLDINLKSDFSGIDLAAKVRKKNKNVYIIFTTGHLEYAMVAFKVKTFDYIAKPITPERLEETVFRLFDDISNSPKNYISIGNKIFLEENEVQYIKRDGMKLVFFTNSGEYELYSSFNKIQDSLPNSFVRCHKSYIANLNNIANVEYNTNTIQFYDNENKCFIGPKYKNDFMEVFNYGNFSNNLDSTDYRKWGIN